MHINIKYLYLCLYLYLHLHLYPYLYLSIYQSIYQSIRLPSILSIYQSIYPFQDYVYNGWEHHSEVIVYAFGVQS